MRPIVLAHARKLVRLAIEDAGWGEKGGWASDPRLSRGFEDVVTQLASVDGKHLPNFSGADSYVLPVCERADPASPDGMPVPPTSLWWNYADTAEKYLDIGRLNIQKMRSVLTEAGPDVRRGDRILDFGCAAGPQIRRLREFAEGESAEKGGEVWGVDVSAPHVTWCMHNLPTCFRFAISTMAPHLPFEDRHFDLVYCGSVFSHMSEMTDAWLLELSRIIRPGGRLYLTVNTKRSMHFYLKWWPQIECSRMLRRAMPADGAIRDMPGMHDAKGVDGAKWGEEPWKVNFAEAVVGRSQFQHSVYNLKHFQRKCEQAHFRVLSATNNAYSFQTAMLLERLETRRGVAAETRNAEVVVKMAQHAQRAS